MSKLSMRNGSGLRLGRERSFADEVTVPTTTKVGLLNLVGRRERVQRYAMSEQL